MMKKTLFSIFGSLALSAGSVLAATELLVSDGFENPTFNGTANRLSTYELNDQTGSLAPLAYSIDGAISSFQVVSNANTVVQTYANDGAGLAFGYATNFEYSEMSIEVDIARKSSAWSSLVIGNTAAASQTGSELFAVRLTSAGDVVVQLEGSGGSTLTFAGLVPNSAALYTVRVDFVNTAYDGTGTATLDLFINDVQQDLNGAIAGMSYTRTGFTDNYISFATQGAASGPDGAFENISIIASVAHGTD